MKRALLAVPTVALLIAGLAACGGSAADGAAPTTMSPQEIAAGGDGPAPESSVRAAGGDTAIYPDGLSVRLTAVDRLSNDLASEMPPANALIRVTTTVVNHSTQAVTEPAGMFALYFGPDRYDAEPEAGYFGSAVQVQSQDPERIAVGSTVKYVRSYSVPQDQLDGLTASAMVAPEHDEHLFTDVAPGFKAAA